MSIAVRKVAPESIRALRDEFLKQIECQFVKHSALDRGFVRVYSIDGSEPLGYGIVQTKFDPDAVVEFYCRPGSDPIARSAFIELLREAKPKEILAQTNMPLLYSMMRQFSKSTEVRSVLFEDSCQTALESSAVVRKVAESDAVFEHHDEPVGSWCAELDGRIVATAGFLTHYNPPYADIFMEVSELYRGQGIGSYLVQEVKKVVRKQRLVPVARCHPENEASRRTLEKAGFTVCGEYVSGLL